MDLVAIEDFQHEGETYRRGITYVAEDEGGYRAHPEHFAESTSEAGRAAQKDRVRSLARDPRNCEPERPSFPTQARNEGPPSFASRAAQATRDEASHVTTTMRYVHHRPGADDAARLSKAFQGTGPAYPEPYPETANSEAIRRNSATLSAAQTGSAVRG